MAHTQARTPVPHPSEPPCETARAEPIQPGLMVIHGNRLEDLRDLLTAWLARAPLQPLEDELMLVQSNGIAQWLKLALARAPEAGGLGISAAVQMQLPWRFLWMAYRAALGREAVPVTSPFDKSRLTWRLLRLIPKHLREPNFAPLHRFLGDDTDWRKHHQLAARVADLFDQYQVYRADWLDDWAHGRDVLRDDLRSQQTALPDDQRWQPELWRALLDDVGAAQRDNHRAAVHRAFMAHMATTPTRPRGLPRRIVVFGISSLPQQTLEALTALAWHCQVLLVVANPCRHYWADIIEERELLKATQRRQPDKPGLPALPGDDELHMHANPLLAAWGRQGRDYVRLLDAFDQPDAYRSRFAAIGRDIDLFTAPDGDKLLHQVQHAILDMEPLPTDATHRTPLKRDDNSLRFHVAHHAQREVEILHDQLLALFEQAARDGKPLAPRDVIVMVPDIRTYAPHIEAVFGRLPPDDPRHLPYTVADQPARGGVPLLLALEKLLNLPESRYGVGEMLDLLDVPALRRRFEIDETDLPVLRRWIEAAGIRWGLDGAQKETFGLPALDQNSWRFGLRRLLLGYAVGDGASLDGIAPCDEVGGLDAALLGPLARWLDALEHHAHLLATPATPGDWCARLRTLLADCLTAADDADTLLLNRLDEALDNWQQACDEAGFVEAIPLAIVREHWLQSVDETRLSQRFMGGAVSFGTLLPMRAIPFRVVCLLGMNDGDYPRQQTAADFDLMALPGHARPGDRSRREDDRYLFLEALLSARDALHVSWVGRSARDNTELPPSVLVGQLRDYLAAGWYRQGDDANAADVGKHVLATLTTEYPLQPFSTRYFDGSNAALFTYAREWRQVHATRDVPSQAATLAPWHPETALRLDDLRRFLRKPVAYFFQQRLKVHFDELIEETDETEPFALDPLQRHSLGRIVTDAAMAGEGIPAATMRLREQGELSPGAFGERQQDELAEQAQTLTALWQTACERWLPANTQHELTHMAGELHVEDWLADLRRDADGAHARLDRIDGTLLENKQPKLHKLVPAWAMHLLANANGLAMRSFVLAVDAQLTLRTLPPEEAARLLDDLLDAMREGMRAPLPIACKTAGAWLGAVAKQNQAQGKGKTSTPPESAAAACYEGNEFRRGEVIDDACLRRAWPDFNTLHAAGFEHWLHLYAPMLDNIESAEGEA